MKALGKAAIVLTILFFVFLIPAGILIALGAVQANNDYDLNGTFQNIIGEVDDYNHIGSIGDGNHIQFSADYVPAGDINGIVIENAAFELNIVRSDKDEFVIEHTGNYPVSLVNQYGIINGKVYSYVNGDVGDASPFFFTEDNGVLTFGLETGYNFDQFNISGFSKGVKCGTVTVYLPASYEGDFTINKSAGEITLVGLTLNSLNITSAAGEFDAKDCTVNSFNVAGIAGDLDFDGKAGSLNLSGGMGDYDIELRAPLTEASTIKGTMGNVNIDMPSGTKLNISSSGNLGDVSIDGDLRADDGVPFSINGNLGDFTISAD